METPGEYITATKPKTITCPKCGAVYNIEQRRVFIPHLGFRLRPCIVEGRLAIYDAAGMFCAVEGCGANLPYHGCDLAYKRLPIA